MTSSGVCCLVVNESQSYNTTFSLMLAFIAEPPASLVDSAPLLAEGGMPEGSDPSGAGYGFTGLVLP